MTQEIIIGLLLGIGLSACCGFRIFIPLLIASVASKMGWISLAENFEWMTSWSAISGFGFASIVEILGYYIPFVDNALDTIAGPVAVIAGTLVSASTMVQLDPTMQWILGIIVGGGTAGIIHAGTSLLRIGSSGATAGLGNALIATGEAGASIFGSIGVILMPIVIGITALIFVVIVSYYLLKKLLKSR
uniref:DUF4126 domain-containing protein n=1 Tax=Fulvivirga sp. TaxID=1931237 RepID=UPI00404A3941